MSRGNKIRYEIEYLGKSSAKYILRIILNFKKINIEQMSEFSSIVLPHIKTVVAVYTPGKTNDFDTFLGILKVYLIA